jgi:hypothetical protein
MKISFPRASGLAAAASAAEPFMQIRFDSSQTDPDRWPAAREALKANPGCADEVWFSTGCGYPALDWHRRQSARCAAAAEDMRRLGIVPSLQIQMTVGHGDFPDLMTPARLEAKTWRGFTGSNGVVCVACSCPRDPAFLDYFEELSEIYAAWKPYCVWIDDDLRMTNHRPVSLWVTRQTDPYGCFCARCRGDYEKVKDRMSWREFSDRSLAAVAGRIAAAFCRISPGTRFGLQGCGDDARLVLAELERVSGHPVSYRSPGCYYYDWDDPRLKIRDALSTWRFVVNQGEEAWRRMDRVCTEIETAPRFFSCRGATSLVMQSMTTIALGMNSMSYFITSSREDPSLCRDRLYPALARTAPDMKAYAAANAGTVSCGFGLEENPTPWPWRLPFYGVPLVTGFSREIGRIVTLASGGQPPDGSVMEREIALARGVTSSVERVELPDGRRYAVLQTPFLDNSAVDMARFGEVQELFAWASHDRTPIVLRTPARVSVFPRTTPDGRLRTVLVQSAELDETPALVFRLNGLDPSADAVRWHETGGASGTALLDRRADGTFVTIPPIGCFGSIWFEVVSTRTLSTAPSYELHNIVPMWLGHEAEQASKAVDLAARTGVRLSLYSLSLHPEGRPAQAKADRLIDSYRAYARALKGTDVRVGVLVQSILGHWPRNDREIEPWTRTIDQDGRAVRFCPLDPGFGAYIDRVFTELACERPAFILTDDDIRAYSHGCECFCPRHVALFNARRGTSYDADGLRAAVATGKPGEADYDAFLALQREMIEEHVVGRIRRAIDAVDPTIPAGVCIAGEEHFFAGNLARRMAAKGQRPIMRCGTGCYFERLTGERFPPSVLRQLAFAEAFRGEGIGLLDEADTCPHNLWSKSSRAFFTHLATSAFAGYAGAKTWFVNAVKGSGVPVSRAYTDVLAGHRDFLSVLSDAVSGSAFRGLMAPCFTRPKNWHMTREHGEFFVEENVCTNLAVAFGVPMGVSRDFGSRENVFALSSHAEVERLSEAELERLLSGRVFVFREAALALTERGRADLLGVRMEPSTIRFTQERASDGLNLPATSSLSGSVRLTMETGAEMLSEFVFGLAGCEGEPVSPASVLFTNRLGGRVVTTAYTPCVHYLERFNEARKSWFVRCLDRLSDGRPPVVAGNDQDVLLLERGTTDARYVLAVNLNPEPIGRLSLRLEDGCRVRRLDDAGIWRPVVQTRCGVFAELDVPVGFYETVVLKIDEL